MSFRSNAATVSDQFRKNMLAKCVINPESALLSLSSKIFVDSIAKQLNDPNTCASTIDVLLKEEYNTISMYSDVVVVSFSSIYQNPKTQYVAILLMKKLIEMNFKLSSLERRTIVEILINSPPHKKYLSNCAAIVQNHCCESDSAAKYVVICIQQKRFEESQREFLREICITFQNSIPESIRGYSESFRLFLEEKVEKVATNVPVFGETPTEAKIREKEIEKGFERCLDVNPCSNIFVFIIFTIITIFLLFYISKNGYSFEDD